jgi:hypothetical protein
VINGEFPVLSGVNLCTQFGGLALQSLAKRLPNSGRSLITIPMRECPK